MVDLAMVKPSIRSKTPYVFRLPNRETAIFWYDDNTLTVALDGADPKTQLVTLR